MDKLSSLMGLCETNPPQVTGISLKMIYLKSHLNFPGANELISVLKNENTAKFHYNMQ